MLGEGNVCYATPDGAAHYMIVLADPKVSSGASVAMVIVVPKQEVGPLRGSHCCVNVFLAVQGRYL